MNNIKFSFSGEFIALEAKKYIGYPYIWDKNGPTSFDCSGFTQYIYMESIGIHLPRRVYEQVKFGNHVSISNLLPGDLVFTFNGEHVGLFIEHGQFIHAPYHREKIKISNILNFYTARRIILN